MSKRKGKAPVQLNPSKRWLLSWDMNDGKQPGASTSHGGTVTMPSDAPETVLDVACGPRSSESIGDPVSAKSKIQAPPHHITPSEYQTLWERADYSITIHEHCPQGDLACRLGQIALGLAPHRLSKQSEPTTSLEISAVNSEGEGCDDLVPDALPKQIPRGRCSLFISSVGPHYLVFDYAPDNVENAPNGLSSRVYFCLKAAVLNEPPVSCLDSVEHVCHHHKSKVKLIRHGYDSKTGRLSLSICLLRPALAVPKFASEPVRRLDFAYHMQNLMHWLHGFQAPAPRQVPTSKRHDFNQLFDAVRRRHAESGNHAIALTIQLQHPCLVPTLREYQRQAVSWMLQKEGFRERKDEKEGAELGTRESGRLHCMWSELQLADQTLFYNYHSGQFTRQRFTQLPPFPGGILADEMGLGKTVEVLACILAHPRYQAAPTPSETNDASVDKEGGPHPTCALTVVDDKPSNSSRCVSEAGTSDTECLSNAALREEMREVVGRVAQEGNAVKAKAGSTSTGPGPMDQSTVGTLQQAETKLEGPLHSSGGGKAAFSDSGVIASQPDMSQHSQETCSLRTVDSSSGMHAERTSSVVSIANPEAQPRRKEQISASVTKTEDTGGPDQLSTTSVQAKHLQTEDFIKPGSVSSAVLLDDMPSGSKHPMSQQRALVSKILETAETKLTLDLDSAEIHVKGEDGNPCVPENVEPPMAKSTDQSVHAASEDECASPRQPSETSPPSDQQSTAATTSAEVGGDASKSSKKPKKKAAPRRPPPNPYLRPASREPPKFRFECICGVREGELDPERSIQCRQCGGWQHSRCVNYSKEFLGSKGYLCPMCCMEQPAVPSGATLIVSPTTICHQWIDEINRHIQSQTLNVLVYNGVKKHGFFQPWMLAKHDIVITTYNTLRTELNYVDLPHTNSETGRRLRHAKRYMAVPSPLPAVEWWRVCLDEAQMVECPTAKVAEMALRLTAVNRWCVTGTPIQKDLDNLYGLFLFLGVEPHWVRSWWDNMLYYPYLHGNQEPMEKALAEVLWRSAKKDVIHQINIPAQTERTHWLQFSPIETHFYKRKQEDCSKDFLEAAGRMKVDIRTRLSTLARDTVHRLMNPLLRLRQACCHPQAVRGEFISMQRTTLSMAELLASLTLKARLESEEAHRQLVCALNGLAAVCIIKGEILDAIQDYREILRSAEEHKDRLKTDSLQRLHATHNLNQLIQLKPDGLVPTLRDGDLEQQVQEIRDAYLAKAEAALQSSIVSLRPLQGKIAELKPKLSPRTPWWLDGLQWLRYVGVEEDFVDKVKDTLMSTTHMDSMSVANHFSTIHGLQMVLVNKLDDLDNAYKRVLAGMEQLNMDVTQELVDEATDCHLRPFGGKPKNRCTFCTVHNFFVEYETCLFSIKQREVLSEADEDESEATGPRVQGSWAASETERILRALLASLRQHGGDREVLEEGGAHIEMMEVQKKEFKSLRATWTMLCERVAAWDELKMATTRLRLREAHEPEEITAEANVIEPGQLDQQRLKLLSDRALAQSELKKKLGQLVYLKSLAQAQSDLPEGNNPEPCPICVRELGKQWTVLPCGHSFCNSCMDMMRVHRGGQRKTLRCAICRAVASLQEISYVSTQPTDQPEDCAIPVKGGFSTKVEAVVRTLLQLQEQDPNVKAIVFSTWVDVLTVIAKALKDNHVEFRSIGSRGERQFKENLMDFKQEDGVTALLLPVHSGSKGLNIIEATHVLLVEPILNPASELQAVGRVHRIGQTKPTVVHRFLVRDTIEERLHAFLQANHTSDSLDSMEGETGTLTLQNLKQLFTDESGAPDSATADGIVDQTDD
ncbi:E3 ubiquitin-protein ligase SHPRH-like isoform X2 [Acanthaster planci]|uniref:E3 ubiquitin-protein ligase SHPRH-like isoform X2 n=1 Tax=Acanthaster planci TaxID=133434 RepID=A0A8B7XMJ0_ACAPL|nr:E3 ubiquitin-protein ligase SHPRH-like isoform X2 [Acanthaster planci]